MLRKIGGYILLSFFSFIFFTVTFHAVASAQTPLDTLAQPSAVAPLIPTPTLFSFPTPQSSLEPTPSSSIDAAPPIFIQQKNIITPTNTPTPILMRPPATTTDIPKLFTFYSDKYHVDEGELKKIAQCESGFNPDSNNNGLYLGMFQFSKSSWINTRSAMGADINTDLRTNSEESIKTAAYMLSKGEQNAWPNCK